MPHFPSQFAAVLAGAAATLLIACVYAGAQWLLAHLYHEKLLRRIPPEKTETDRSDAVR